MSATNIFIVSCSCNESNKIGVGKYLVKLSRTQPTIAASLRSVSFRNVFYNVESEGERKNNVFRFTLGGTPNIIVVPRGFYDINTLLALLNTEISTILASSGIIPLPTLDDLSYSSLTGKVSITINGNGVATPFQLDGGIDYKSINEILGNTQIISLDTLTPTAYEFDSLINLGGVDAVIMRSQKIAPSTGIASRRNTAGANINLIKVVSNDAVFGGLVRYETPDIDAESFIYDKGTAMTPDKIDFSFEDSDGNALDFSNSEILIELQCWKKLEG